MTETATLTIITFRCSDCDLVYQSEMIADQVTCPHCGVSPFHVTPRSVGAIPIPIRMDRLTGVPFGPTMPDDPNVSSRFALFVARAIAGLPAEIRRYLRHRGIRIRAAWACPDREDDVRGIYIPRMRSVQVYERGCRAVATEEELAAFIESVVWHEVAHALGFDHDEMRRVAERAQLSEDTS